MSRIVLLDSGPLGLASNPGGSPESVDCTRWLMGLLSAGVIVVIPEIADYEVRRELLRANKVNGLKRLDALRSVLSYLPLTTEAMLKAAEYWADARKRGKPTAEDKALDGDVILAAQASTLSQVGDTVLVATTNVGHISLFCNAQKWQDIK